MQLPPHMMHAVLTTLCSVRHKWTWTKYGKQMVQHQNLVVWYGAEHTGWSQSRTKFEVASELNSRGGCTKQLQFTCNGALLQ